MPEAIILPEARIDLAEMYIYLAGDDIGVAERMAWEIDRRFHLLTERPHLGRLSGYADDLRRFAVPPYVIFYRPIEDGVEILRVLHGSRDLATIFHADEGV